MNHLAESLILVVLVSLILSSCTSTIKAPIDHRETEGAYRAATVSNYGPEPVSTGPYQVVSGDTLYSIAWRYGLDYRDIARWNNINAPYRIFVGQKIRLTLAPEGTQADPPVSTATRSSTVTSTTTPAQPVPKPALAAKPGAIQQDIKWQWPTTGVIVRSNTPTARNGVGISGREGQSIQAAADGTVVYSGSGLLGYGKLIIIKHNDTYLSAYAHNRVIDVREGDTVIGGQKIATMGRGSKGEPLLHFEIRKDGRPADPLQYLPARS